jgi:hypothetical protein
VLPGLGGRFCGCARILLQRQYVRMGTFRVPPPPSPAGFQDGRTANLQPRALSYFRPVHWPRAGRSPSGAILCAVPVLSLGRHFLDPTPIQIAQGNKGDCLYRPSSGGSGSYQSENFWKNDSRSVRAGRCSFQISASGCATGGCTLTRQISIETIALVARRDLSLLRDHLN